jgi:hypothetical protein
MEITGSPGRKTQLKESVKTGENPGPENDTVPGNDCVKKAIQFVD